MGKRGMQLTRVCSGLYMDTRNGVSVEHEVTWRESESRKWIASWKMYGLGGLGEATVRCKKFDTSREARDFLRKIVSGKTDPSS